MGVAEFYCRSFNFVQTIIGLAMAGYAAYLFIDIGSNIFTIIFATAAGLMLLTGLAGWASMRGSCGHAGWAALLVVTTLFHAAQLIALLFFRGRYIDAIADTDIASEVNDNVDIARGFSGVAVAACLLAIIATRVLARKQAAAIKATTEAPTSRV
jgi:nitrate reductase gamma subunit